MRCWKRSLHPTYAVAERKCKYILRWHQFTALKLHIWDTFIFRGNSENLTGMCEPLDTLLSILCCIQVHRVTAHLTGLYLGQGVFPSAVLSFLDPKSPTNCTLQKAERKLQTQGFREECGSQRDSTVPGDWGDGAWVTCMKVAQARAEQHRNCQRELQLYSSRTLSSHKPRIICGSHIAKLTKYFIKQWCNISVR